MADGDRAVSVTPSLGTFASTLSAAIERKQTTLSEIRARLATKGHSISLTALSYWRSGQRLPEYPSSLAAIPALESLLDLEPGILSRLVSGLSARRLGQVEGLDQLLTFPVVDPVAGESRVGESDVSRLAAHMTVTVGPQRTIVSTRMRRVVVANRDGVEGYTVFLATDVGGVDGYRFRALAGCSIREERRAAHNARSVQLRFPRPLMSGESAITEIEITKPDEAECEFGLAAEQRLEEALIWVNFDPGTVPPRCWMYFTEGGRTHEWSVDIGGTSSVHCRQRDFGPGCLGIRWDWDE